MKDTAKTWTIKQRCSADWEKMRGDDKRRFCESCQKFVHNVSAMSRTERETFADLANRRECVFYSQRPDGEILDLSFLVKLRRWLPFLRLACWSALLALLPVTLTGCMGARCPQPGEIRPIVPETATNSIPPARQTGSPKVPQ